MHRQPQATPGRIFRALFAVILLLNGAVPAMSNAMAMPVGAAQSQHDGHDMSDMTTSGDSAGQPTGDCCDDSSMDCPCGCFVFQPGAPQFATAIRDYDRAAQSAVAVISRHTSGPVTSPFRPPA